MNSILIVATLVERYPHTTIIMTLGAEGALGCAPGGQVVRQPAFPAQEVGRLGGGDAFAAGFLFHYLTTPESPHRLSQALAWGAALAALKYSILGDMPLVERHEVVHRSTKRACKLMLFFGKRKESQHVFSVSHLLISRRFVALYFQLSLKEIIFCQ